MGISSHSGGNSADHPPCNTTTIFFFDQERGVSAVRTQAFFVKEKYANVLQHTRPAPLMVSPTRLLERTVVVSAFQLSAVYAPRQ